MLVVVVVLVVAVLAGLVWYGDVVQKREQAGPADLVIDDQVIERIMGELEARMGDRFGSELQPLLTAAVAEVLNGDTEPLLAARSGVAPLRWDEQRQAWTDGSRWY